MFRNDKHYEEANVTRGGDVMCSVKKKFKPALVAKSDSVDFQWICVKMDIINVSISICCVYISCGAALSVYEDFVNLLQLYVSAHSYDHIIIVGDFNVAEVHSSDFKFSMGSLRHM